MKVRVLAFARLRELLGFGSAEHDVPEGTTLEGLWDHLTVSSPELRALRASTRFAHNGALCTTDSVLAAGDEVALMPPVGGG